MCIVVVINMCQIFPPYRMVYYTEAYIGLNLAGILWGRRADDDPEGLVHSIYGPLDRGMM